MSFDILFGMKIVTEIMEDKWYGDEFISHISLPIALWLYLNYSLEKAGPLMNSCSTELSLNIYIVLVYQKQYINKDTMYGI